MKSGYSKLLDEMNRSKTPILKNSLEEKAGQNSHNVKNPYALMLSEVLPGVGGLNNSDTVKRSEGDRVETRVKPVITHVGTLSPPNEEEIDSSQRKTGVDIGQEYAGRCDTNDYSTTKQSKGRRPIRTNLATAGYPSGGESNLHDALPI